MEVKLKLSNSEHKDLVDYCNLNDLLISSVVKDSFTTGYRIEKYGLLNSGIEERVVEKEVIVEKRIEIPVEVPVEIVKYVEVPVEIIKEVEVIKEVEKEVIKEVPVEIIKEKVLNVIQEVPVEKVVVQEVIKEVPVDRIVYVTDQQEMNEKIFQKDQEIESQRRKFSTKTQELENIFQKEKDDLLLKIQQLESKEPEIVIQEVIREIEKPVEVIIEKEVIREVEKPVIDNSKSQMLQETIQKLRGENIEKDKQIKELEKRVSDLSNAEAQRGAVYLRGSNLNDTLYK
jgi:hypothetical protein